MSKANHIGWCNQEVETDDGAASLCERRAVILTDDSNLLCADCLESSRLSRSEVREANEAGKEALKRFWTQRAQEAARKFVADPSDKNREDLRAFVDNIAICAGDYSPSRRVA